MCSVSTLCNSQRLADLRAFEIGTESNPRYRALSSTGIMLP